MSRRRAPARRTAAGAAHTGTAAPDPRILRQPTGESALLHDYLAGEPALSRFYFGHPGDIGAYERKAEEVTARFDSERRRAIAAALRPVSAAAEAKLQAVVTARGFMVTTGQQAGLFGGPLFTVYKALTAVRLAETLEAKLGVPVLPVFWIASEDHDWAEVNHTFVPGEDDAPVRITLDRAAGSAEPSMARQPVGESAAAAIRELARLLPAGAATAELLAMVRHAYSPGATVAGAFRTLLEWLLAELPVCTISAADPELKRLSVPLLRTALEQADTHAEAVARQSRRLTRAGYAAQVAIEDGATHVHYEDESGRERLLRAGDGFRLRRTKRTASLQELTTRLAADPTCISPGALLRPVIESALLPTLAYVGGPAETSYFAQIGCLFASYGVMPPVVVPRAAFLLVERPVDRLLGKLGLEADAVEGDTATFVRAQLDAELPSGAEKALAGARLETTESWSRLRAEAEAIDPTVAVPLQRLEAAAMRQVDEAEARIRLHHRRRHAERARQLERVCGRLRPFGKPQERVLNVLPFVAQHGRGMLRDVAAAIEIEFADGDRWSGPACTT